MGSLAPRWVRNWPAGGPRRKPRGGEPAQPLKSSNIAARPADPVREICPMITKPTLPRPTWVAALTAAVLTAGLAPAKAPAPPPAPETLKQSVLQLNNVTGTTVIEG